MLRTPFLYYAQQLSNLPPGWWRMGQTDSDDFSRELLFLAEQHRPGECWEIALPAACVVCGRACAETEQTAERTVPDLSVPCRAGVAGVLLGLVLWWFVGWWCLPFALIMAVWLSYFRRREQQVSLKLRRCQDHAGDTIFPHLALVLAEAEEDGADVFRLLLRVGGRKHALALRAGHKRFKEFFEAESGGALKAGRRQVKKQRASADEIARPEMPHPLASGNTGIPLYDPPVSETVQPLETIPLSDDEPATEFEESGVVVQASGAMPPDHAVGPRARAARICPICGAGLLPLEKHCPKCANSHLPAGRRPMPRRTAVSHASVPTEFFHAWLDVRNGFLGGYLRYQEPMFVSLGNRLTVESKELSEKPRRTFIDERIEAIAAVEVRQRSFGGLFARQLGLALLGALTFSLGLAAAGVLSWLLPLGTPAPIWFLVALMGFPLYFNLQALMGLRGCLRRTWQIVLRQADDTKIVLWAEETQLDEAVQSIATAGIQATIKRDERPTFARLQSSGLRVAATVGSMLVVAAAAYMIGGQTWIIGRWLLLCLFAPLITAMIVFPVFHGIHYLLRTGRHHVFVLPIVALPFLTPVVIPKVHPTVKIVLTFSALVIGLTTCLAMEQIRKRICERGIRRWTSASKFVLVAGGVLLGVGFGLACWRVRSDTDRAAISAADAFAMTVLLSGLLLFICGGVSLLFARAIRKGASRTSTVRS